LIGPLARELAGVLMLEQPRDVGLGDLVGEPCVPDQGVERTSISEIPRHGVI